MAKEYDDLVETLIFLITRRLESKREFTRGLLGDGLGNVDVPQREGFSFVRPDRSSNKILEIFNKRVFSADGTPVLIGEIPWQPGLSQVLDIDWDTYLTVGWPNRFAGIAQHGDTHVWRDGFIGEDPFSVYRRQIFDLRCEPIGSGTTSVIVTPYGLNDAGTLKTWPGSPGIDLAPAIPGTTGTVRNALVYWDYSGETLYGTLGVATGTLDTVTETSIPPKPVEPVGSIASAYVQLQGGQAQITEADIKDARPIFSTPTVANDGVKVSKVWESDFEAVALQSDATGLIGIQNPAPDSQVVVGGAGNVWLGAAGVSGSTVQGTAYMDEGLVINADGDKEHVALKDSRINHGMTDDAEVDTFGTMAVDTGALGGLAITGYQEGDGPGVRIFGVNVGDSLSKNTLSTAPVMFSAKKKSGTTSGDVGAGANVGVFRNNLTTVWIVDETGSTWQWGSITLGTDIIHEGDPDTKISFTDDDIEFTVGNLSMLKLTEAAQDLIALGPGSGDVDINFNGDALLEGSSGNLILGDVTAPSAKLVIFDSGTPVPTIFLNDGDITTPFSIGAPPNDANTIGRLGSASSADGGVVLSGWTDSTAGANTIGVWLEGYLGSASPIAPAITLNGYKTNGATGSAALAAGELVLQITNAFTTKLATILGNGDFGILTVDPTTPLNTGFSNTGLTIGDGTGTRGIVLYSSTTSTLSSLRFGDGGGGNYDQGFVLYDHNNDKLSFGANRGTAVTIDSSQNVGVNGVTSPSAELDMGAGAIEFAEMTAPGGGAANTVRLYADDNGAGKTRLMAVFSTGAAQQVAIQP